VHPKKTYRSVREEQEYVLAAFPNIGLRSARLLLEHFGSLKAIIDADPEELASVHGIGEKTRRVYGTLPAGLTADPVLRALRRPARLPSSGSGTRRPGTRA